jgi:uncharacterized membrane protein
MTASVNDNVNKERLARLCAGLYCVYAAVAFLQAPVMAMAVGTAALLVAVAVAYVKRRTAEGTIFESHLRWLIRTFWIGGAVYLPVVTVLGSVAFVTSMDMRAIVAAMENGNEDIAQLSRLLVESNASLVNKLRVAFGMPFVLWWLWRCWKGFKFLKEGKPVPDVMRWF